MAYGSQINFIFLRKSNILFCNVVEWVANIYKIFRILKKMRNDILDPHSRSDPLHVNSGVQFLGFLLFLAFFSCGTLFVVPPPLPPAPARAACGLWWRLD